MDTDKSALDKHKGLFNINVSNLQTVEKMDTSSI